MDADIHAKIIRFQRELKEMNAKFRAGAYAGKEAAYYTMKAEIETYLRNYKRQLAA